MEKYIYPVECPLMRNKKIDKYTCFEIHTVVQGVAPTSIVPQEIFENENFIEICERCKFHRND